MKTTGQELGNNVEEDKPVDEVAILKWIDLVLDHNVGEDEPVAAVTGRQSTSLNLGQHGAIGMTWSWGPQKEKGRHGAGGTSGKRTGLNRKS